LAVPDQQAIAAEQQLLNEPSYQGERDKVVAFVKRLQRARNAEDFVYLHRDVLIEFGARQDAADEVLPQARANTRAEIAELARQNPKPIAEIQEKQEVLKRIERQGYVAKAMQHTLRQLGDGIAWRALKYDRRAFTILGDGQRVGRLAQGVGGEAELLVLGELWENEGVFAIHNDMTNCLRHGDLTAIRPQDGALDVTLIEVKAGNAPTDSPQLRRLERATELLRSGRHPSGADDSRAVHVNHVPAPYRTFLANLPPLLATARRRGHAWTRPAPSLLVGAVDYRVWGTRADEMSARSNELRGRVGWRSGEEDALDWVLALRRMRDRSESFSSLAPVTIFPLPPEDVADLVMGFMDLATSLHLSLLERALTRNGIEVRIARPPESNGLFLEASRGRVGVLVPPHLREQMMTELMTPYSLSVALDYVLELNAARPEEGYDSRIVSFADEERVWEPRPR
jgi:hypothetical protein